MIVREFSPLFANDMPYMSEVQDKIGVIGSAEAPYAWHGTSIEAIVHLAIHGTMPTSGSYGERFFYAPEDTDPGNQRDHALMYADWNVEKQHVLSQLPFTPRDMPRFMYLREDNTWDDFMAEEADEYGLTKEAILDLYTTRDPSKKGVLLGLTEDVRTHDVRRINDEESVVIADGFPLKYINHIEPLGPYERAQLFSARIAFQNSLRN